MNAETSYYLLLIGITIAIALVLYFGIRFLLDIFIRKYASKLRSDPTNFSFIKNSVGFLVLTAALIFIFYKIPYLKSVGAALFAGAGILAIIVGFASQKAFANIIGGLFILFFKPFKINDTISFNDGQKGVVEEITLRHTVIKDYENRRIIIPNSIISEETIINSSIHDERIRKHIVFSISYDSDIDKAMGIIVEEAQKHPLAIDPGSKEDQEGNIPVVTVRVIELSDFSVNLKAWVWAKGNDDAFVLQCDLLKSVKERFDNEGIEIPFPYRTLVYKNDLNEKKNNPEP